MKILIVDDEQLARELVREMLKPESCIEFINEAKNGREAVQMIRAEAPDIVFLDIQMPDMDGFEVLESLSIKELLRIPAIIFVTAYDQYALQAFEYHALDYLLKPFDRERFTATLNRAKEIIRQREGGEHQQQILKMMEQLKAPPAPDYLEWLTIKKNERILMLRVEDIHWIEAQGNYVQLKFENASHLLREKMDSLEAQLNPKTFVRIHRSTIVNANHIKELQVWTPGEYRVLMQGGKTFTLSRGYRNRFDSFLKKSLV
ncbi:MAG: LytTR family DNA-binding domain-containing protein [Acidobacteriota bacterium]|nr:LytTR family DNA-binding domain-containing protein [Acidobacteriota bacterium]